MKRSITSTAAILAGTVLGQAARRLIPGCRTSGGDEAMRRLTAYFIIPVWIGAGFLDYIWHRRTHIENTSGLEESLIHSVMMMEAGPPVLAALFLEINPGVLAGMIGLAVLHELTVLWDLWFTAPRRAIPAGEQVTHTFLEAPPFLTAAAAIATHWNEFLAITGRSRARRRARIRLRQPAVPLPGVLAIFAALALFGALPHFDELRRCFQAAKAGRVGEGTPARLPEVLQ